MNAFSPAAMIRTALKDAARASAALLVGATLLSGYQVFKMSYGNPHDYYTYQGAEGPISLTRATDGAAIAGTRITAISPGQEFGWVSSLCLGPGVYDTSHVSLVRVDAPPGTPPANGWIKHYSPQDRRCGPTVAAMGVPADALPGVYEARRWIILREESWWPLRVDLEPIKIQVLPKVPD